jgi:hypothetical protein
MLGSSMTKVVAYDTDRQPGVWVTAKAALHIRIVWLVICLFGAVAIAAFAMALSPRRTIIGGLVILVAVGLMKLVGERQTDIALRWRRGAAAERSVGETLNLLRREGFIVMHDVEQSGEGNIDHIVSGPTGVYLIETKARGYQDVQLVKARRQAAKLHDELATWVTPVICLHERHGKPFRHDRVWIVPHPSLLEWIRSQRDPVVEFERLARYADRV